MPKYTVICLDFDGTCVENTYPTIGKPIDAERWLAKCAKKYDIRYILWTMRTGNELMQAMLWCAAHEVPIWAVCGNPDQARWSKSPKVYGHLYIEDTALGLPLVHSAKKPFVNWHKAGPMLEEWCIANATQRNE